LESDPVISENIYSELHSSLGVLILKEEDCGLLEAGKSQ
jgi:hypothetical protein